MPVTEYIWDGDNILAETDGTGAVQVVYTNEPQQYGNVISQRRGAVTNYFHFDGLGSTRQLTVAAGTTTDTFLHTAWGETVARTGATSVAFTWIGMLGYVYDAESGTFYVRRRFYLPGVARWRSLDPLRESEFENRYAYVFNNPASTNDPSGLLGEPATVGYFCVQAVFVAACCGTCTCSSANVWGPLLGGIMGPVMKFCCEVSCLAANMPAAQPRIMMGCTQRILRALLRTPLVTCTCTYSKQEIRFVAAGS